MKKIIVYAMLLFVSTTSFSQRNNPGQPLVSNDYLKKSKGQKTIAWVLLGGGTALIGTGLLMGNKEESSFDNAETAGVIAGIGVLSAIGSIPLFIASGRNKRKAMNVSADFKIQQNPVARQTGFTFQSSPALAVKLVF